MVTFDTQPFDLGKENVRSIKAPLLLIKGDNDGVELHHIEELYGLVGGNIFGDIRGLPKSQLADGFPTEAPTV